MNRACPGCGLEMPLRESAVNAGDYNASPECWAVYTEVLAAEYSNALIFGRAHQLTVDTYAVQHAGGPHPDKSVAIHLCGLHLTLDRGVSPPTVPPILQRVAAETTQWPHFPPPPPATMRFMTVCDIALAASPEEHVQKVRAWAEMVWRAWAVHHGAVAGLVGGVGVD
ncbi:MAG TPA: DUF5946 family protein [Thermoanaerobaculia bacterium]|nr:DUF5946 family protein [Thermoanaerobaculia bacterium]